MWQESFLIIIKRPRDVPSELFSKLNCMTINQLVDYFTSFIRLSHWVSELSGFTCTSSLTMNKKFQYRTRMPSAVSKNFEFIVSERVQVNTDNSRAMSALTFYYSN